jgi:phosphatidate cytidylyltransferase
MAAPAEPSTHWSKKPLTLRIISAAVLIPIVVAAVYAGGLAWSGLVVLFGITMIAEWCTISARHGETKKLYRGLPIYWSSDTTLPMLVVALGLMLFAYHDLGWTYYLILLSIGAVLSFAIALAVNRVAGVWLFLGIFYVGIPCAAIIWLRADAAVGLQQIFWIVALVIAADTGAYIAGRSIGGPKLAPRVSPNKTWAGLFGAVVSAAIVGAITALLMDLPSVATLTAVSAGLAVIEQMGDLAESAFKRHFGVKDASNIIPGHGGALDRVDGLIAVAAAVAGINYLIGSSVLTWL